MLVLPFGFMRKAASYPPSAVSFDGSDYLTKTTALAGAATKQFSLYARIKPAPAIYGSNSVIVNIGDGAVANNQILRVRWEDGTGNSNLGIQFRDYPAYNLGAAGMLHKTSEIFTDSAFYNILFSFDSQNGVQASHFYIGDTAASGYSDTPTLDYELAWDQNLTSRIGTQHNVANPLRGDVGAIWMAPIYYDFTSAANRRLFFDAVGNPVAPPSGAVIYFGGRQNAAAWNAGINQGTSGNFTVNGAITDA